MCHCKDVDIGVQDQLYCAKEILDMNVLKNIHEHVSMFRMKIRFDSEVDERTENDNRLYRELVESNNPTDYHDVGIKN